MAVARGSPVRGEFSSSDATALSEANARFALYGAGSTTPLTLAANDQLQLDTIVVATAVQGTLTLFDGADGNVDAGETLFKADLGAHSTVTHNQNQTPVCLQPGTWPHLKAGAAGAVSAVITGSLWTPK